MLLIERLWGLNLNGIEAVVWYKRAQKLEFTVFWKTLNGLQCVLGLYGLGWMERQSRFY